MSVFIIQYMQIRAYIKRILRYSYWCKKCRNIILRWRISSEKVESESIDEAFERSHVFLLTIFIVSVMPSWILIFFWQAWTSNKQIVYWIDKYIENKYNFCYKNTVSFVFFIEKWGYVDIYTYIYRGNSGRMCNRISGWNSVAALRLHFIMK